MQDHNDTTANASRPLPYEGIRVVEFTHMVMGPTCGMVLAELGYGAEDAAQLSRTVVKAP